MKSNLHANLDIHWLSILQGRFEAPLFDGFDSLRVESKPQAADNTNVARHSLVVDD